MTSLYERLNDAKLAFVTYPSESIMVRSNDEAAKLAMAIFADPGDAIKPGRIHPGVGVGCVFIDSSHQGYPRILLLKRAGSHGAGLWAVPGGWVDKGEEPWQTAEREMLEETGMIVTSERTPFNVSTDVQDDVHSVTLWYMCTSDSEEWPQVMEPEKCTMMQFMYLNGLEKASFQMFGSLRDKIPVIREYLDSKSPEISVQDALRIVGANWSEIVTAIKARGAGGQPE